ncbi:MAG TPA: winged helix-turn-helix domain-containing protein [Candidatus Nanoarchaeia archaeon]|nr:winged helix-turn-helix domain-containing protein [Candidatus Nanoarchaeia archaeon]
MKCDSYENFFMNFSNKTKFRIVMHLKDSPMSVNELSKRMGEEQSKISHNLAKLAACNIITVKQKGKQRIYSLNKDTVIPVLKLVEQHVKKHCAGGCHR